MTEQNEEREIGSTERKERERERERENENRNDANTAGEYLFIWLL